MPSAATAEIRGDYCRIYRVKNIRQLYHESIFSSSLVVLFFCQKLGNFFDQLLFSLSWTANVCDPSTIIKSSYGGNLVDLPCCYASNRKRGDYFCCLISTIILRENDQSRRPKSSLEKHRFKLAPLE